MVFMFEERIHITIPCLTRDIHSWKKLQVTLHVFYFVFWLCCRRIFCFTGFKELKIVFLNIIIEWFIHLEKVWFNKRLILFPIASAVVILSITFSDIITFVSSAKRLSLVSVNGLPNSLKTSITLRTFVANLFYCRYNLFMMSITTYDGRRCAVFNII